MEHKIGRNNLCPCGSGKKYKKCCMNRIECHEDFTDRFLNALAEAKKEANSIKFCLHPQQMECSGHIVKAHAIQNNRVLSALAVDGLVQMTDGVSNVFFQDVQSRGRKIATTFSGFCEHHDKVTFQEIEDFEFVRSEKQIFLFTYRTFAWHYCKKMLQNARERHFDLVLQLNTGERMEFMQSLSLANRENEQKKMFFDRHLLDNDYSGFPSSDSFTAD